MKPEKSFPLYTEFAGCADEGVADLSETIANIFLLRLHLFGITRKKMKLIVFSILLLLPFAAASADALYTCDAARLGERKSVVLARLQDAGQPLRVYRKEKNDTLANEFIGFTNEISKSWTVTTDVVHEIGFRDNRVVSYSCNIVYTGL